MFRQFAARAPLCVGVLAASTSNRAHGSRFVAARLPLELTETHRLKFTPLSADLSALLLKEPPASDQNNNRHTSNVSPNTVQCLRSRSVLLYKNSTQ